MLLLLAASSFTSSAQSPNDWYLSKVLDDNNGLPQNSVRSLYYDTKTDFLWLATEAGLVRYDGQDARVFGKQELPVMQSMRILNLFPTANGQVKGCNNLGDVFTLNQNYPTADTGKHISPEELVELHYRTGNVKSVTDIATEAKISAQDEGTVMERSTTLWLSARDWLTSSKNYISLVRNNQIVYRWPKPPGEVLKYIVRGKNLYAINSNGKGWCLDIATKNQIPTAVESEVLASEKARFFYDKLNDQPLLLLGNEVHEIIFKSNIVSTRLLAILPKVPTYITALVLGKSRRHLFVGTNATGLYIYHLSPFRVYTAKGDDAINNNYACVLVDSNHLLTSKSLLFNLSTGDAQKIPVTMGLYAMAADTAGNIWNSNSYSIKTFALSKPLQETGLATGTLFQTIYRSKQGRVWFSTGQQLNYAEGKTVKTFVPYNSPESSLTYLTEAPDGQLFGITPNRIYQVDTVHKKLITILQDSQLTQIRSIYIDNDWNCWVGTYGEGIFLYQLKKKKLTRLPVDDYGYLQYSHIFIDDNHGNFIVPTNKGLFRISKSNLLQIANHQATSLCYQYFNVNNGLLTNEFNGGCQPAYNRLPNGDIMLPAIQGVVRVKLKELPNPANHSLFIDLVETGKSRYQPGKNLSFTKTERVQIWHLSFTQWDQPNVQGIFYRLDGNNWERLPAGERKIQLNELKGGQHLLEIKYQYGLQPDQVVVLTQSFSIDRLYYETIWFWLGLLLLAGALVYLFIRIRIRQLRAKNIQLQKIINQNTAELSDKNGQLEETLLDLREALKGLRENSIFKDRLIGLIGHDMLLPLRFIARIANHLHDEAAVLSPAVAKENSKEIKNTVTELLYLGESLVQWIKLQEGRFRLIVKPIELRQMTEEIMQVHLPMAAVKNNELTCTITAGTFCRYDAVFLKVLLHNLLLNANKFTAEGAITVAASIVNNELHFEVSDTGAGMNADMVASLNKGISIPSQLGTNKEAGWGMGYLLIIDLLRFAEGKLLVASEMDKGTRVQFVLSLTVAENNW
jgi:signal transduction histidine kinase/ligand-binding sensor domain-containing protein